MAFVDDHEVIVTPIDVGEFAPIATTLITGEVTVKKHIIAESIGYKRVVHIVAVIGFPVVMQLLGTKHQHIAVAPLVILDDGKGCEGFTQTHAIGENTTVVFLQLVDDGQGRIALEIIEFVPNYALLEASGLVGQYILADVIEKLIEYIIQRDEVKKLWCVLFIDIGDAVNDLVGDRLKHLAIVPNLLKELEELLRLRVVVAQNHRIGVVTLLSAQVNGREAIYGCVGSLVNVDETLHVLCGTVRFEARLLPDPFSTFAGNSPLCQLIAQSDLKF